MFFSNIDKMFDLKDVTVYKYLLTTTRPKI